MAIQFSERTITFNSRSGSRRRSSSEGLTQTVSFGGRRVINAQVMLKGFNIRYNNGDHHLLETEIDLDHAIIDADGNGINDSVRVDADFVLRDSSGVFDDPYSGFVQFVIVADVE